MVNYYKIENNKLRECPKEESLVMLYVSPIAVEINDLIQNYHIDDHDISSSLDPNELSRLEFEDDYTLLILKRPQNYCAPDNLLFKVNSVGIFLQKDRMIVIMAEKIQLFEGKLFTKIKTLSDVLIKLLYGTISHFLEHLKVINLVSEELEQKINTSMNNKYLLNMFTLEKSLVYYVDGITSNVKVINKIKHNAQKIGFTADNIETLEDIIVENEQCQKQAEIYLNILTGLMDARSSIVNNNVNVLIKRLTIINIIFMPLTLLTSIGGMSEYTVMMQGLGFGAVAAYILLLIGLVGVGFLTYFLMDFLLKKLGLN
jgi:magnesium transporter